MLLRVLIVCCVCGGACAVTKEETVVRRLYQRLRSPRSSPKTEELWLTGKEADHGHHDCLSRSKFLTSSQLKELSSPPTNPTRSYLQLLEFTSSETAVSGPLLNATVWFPSHILHHVTKIYFLHCQKKDSLNEIHFRRVHRRKGAKKSDQDGRSFDVAQLFASNGLSPAKPDIGYFVSILHFSSMRQQPQHKTVESSEQGPSNTPHISVLPKPYLHLVYAEAKKSAVKKSSSVTTRYCDELENGTGEGGKVRQCCLRRLDVDFAKLGWHWVERPHTMRVHYCDGYCPHPYGGGNTDTNEGSFLRFLNGARPATGQLCCVASEYRRRHVSVRSPQAGRTVIRSLEDIDAAACSCLA